jgi:hypothetical protein
MRRLIALLAAVTLLPSVASATMPVVAEPVPDAGRCDPIDPAHCLFPFPNDHFTGADPSTDTGRRLDLDPLSMPRNVAGVPINPVDYNRNDGFSPGQLIVTKVPGLDTPAAFAATGAVPITDLARTSDPDQPVVVLNADTGQRHLIWAELDATADDPADAALLIRPAVNFDEGARYIVALRNMRRADGSLIEASPAFRRFREARGAGDPRAQHYEEVFATLAEAGIARDELFLAWDFTVASERNLSERMLHLRDDAFAQLGDRDLGDLTVAGASPTFRVDRVTDFTVQQNARVLRRVEGSVTVPCYLNLPGCPPGSQFAYESLDATLPTRIPGNTMQAPFICNLPRAAATAPARPSLYGHGLLNAADEVNQRKLYELGADHHIAFCATDWKGMSEEDIANDAALLAELGRFSTLADRVQQGMLNFLFLGRAMIHPGGFVADPAFQIDGQPALDTSRLYYDGGSQGGIIGAALTAVAPDFTRAALGVPGMNYSTLLSRSVDFDDFAVIMDAAYPDQLQRPLLFSLIQILWDRAEANGYAHHITDDPYPDTPTHEVLLHEAFGDHQVTNIATEVMARTVGAALREPALDPGRHTDVDPYYALPRIDAYPHAGSALVVWDVGPLRTVDGKVKGTTPPPTTNTPNREGIDPHGPDASETADGQCQIAEFLRPDGQVVAVCGEGPCYLDGWTGPPQD